MPILSGIPSIGAHLSWSCRAQGSTAPSAQASPGTTLWAKSPPMRQTSAPESSRRRIARSPVVRFWTDTRIITERVIAATARLLQARSIRMDGFQMLVEAGALSISDPLRSLTFSSVGLAEPEFDAILPPSSQIGAARRRRTRGNLAATGQRRAGPSAALAGCTIRACIDGRLQLDLARSRVPIRITTAEEHATSGRPSEDATRTSTPRPC